MLKDILVLLIALKVTKCDHFYFASEEYEYLPRYQGIFRINLSFPVTIDRKQYNDMWVYKNGFATLGAGLEEETYPILTGSGTIGYQPFENLIGENIIAVFIAVNKESIEGKVRIKQLPSKVLKDKNKKTFGDLENIILKGYGQMILRPMEYLVVVEWIKMQIEGEKENENSFNLYIVSSDIQSFVFFQYRHIKSVSYKLFEQTFQYQSGIRSYANRHFILPFYNISGGNISSEKTSNINIDNSWLLNLGDVSYSLDLGLFLTLPSDKVVTQNTKVMFPNDKYYEEEIFPKLKNRETFTLEMNKSIFRKKQTSESERSQFVILKGRTNNSQNRKTSSLTNHENKYIKFILRSSTKRYFYENLDPTLKTYAYTKKTKLSPTYRKRRETAVTTVTKNILNLTRLGNQKSTKFLHRKQRTYGGKSVILEKLKKPTSHQSFIKDYYIETKNLLMKKIEDGIFTDTLIKCSINSCDINQQCFMHQNFSCCICPTGKIHSGSRCFTKDKELKMRSFGSVSIPQEDQFLKMDLSIAVKVIDDVPTTYITLQSNHNMEHQLRNFILILYPIFHIPMAFYANSWKQQKVPNLSSLVKQMAGINIYIEIEGYGDLYVTYKLNRTTNDQWIISVNRLNMERLAALNLGGLKLDEKFKNPLYLRYVLSHKSSVEFTEQSVNFFDESKNYTIEVKWRGTMTFDANCLSHYINNKEYFVKFADNGYCNTDCTGSENSNCRMMCLSFPFVFEKIPDLCEGTLCPTPFLCVIKDSRYDCQCSPGLLPQGDTCIESSTTTETNSFLRRDTGIGCVECSAFANCRILNSQSCCLCNSGYVGSGKSCFKQESQFEIDVYGYVTLVKENAKIMSKAEFKLLFRQRYRETSINYETFVETGPYIYKSSKEKDILHLILLLSPIFDVPMSLFAMDKTHDIMTSVYAISKGSLTLTIKVSGVYSSPLFIIFNMFEKKDSIEINASIKEPTQELNKTLWFTNQILFERRSFPNIKYKIKGKQFILLPYSIQPFGNASSKIIIISGSGKMGECADEEEDERLLVVSTQQLFYCKSRFENHHFNPYCHAIPRLNIIRKVTKCRQRCHHKAKCIRHSCICRPGYSGNGFFCRTIEKILECNKSLDCNHAPFLECRDRKCLCRSGTVLKENKCVLIEPCQNCRPNERCENNECVCQSQFIKNRVSNLCTFDCSLCDIYSTTCFNGKCVCKKFFIYDTKSNLFCTLKCQSESDCPENEFCDHMKKCVCPTKRVSGLCEKITECTTCNGNAICIQNKCECISGWVGNGLECHYNCSACFNKLYCDANVGCSCPPDYIGDGKTCKAVTCPTCSVNSICKKVGTEYRCECIAGKIKKGEKCIDDDVHIDIMPLESPFVNRGDKVEIFCMVNSKIKGLSIFWSRKSGRPIRGYQHFLDGTNKTLQLTISTMKMEDDDEYICAVSSGQYKTVSIRSESESCLTLCHKFATCVSGRCECNIKYTGDGINCVKRDKCPSKCPDSMVCNEDIGQCQCRPGFRQEKFKCFQDCRLQQMCDVKGECNNATGHCQCRPGYIGNGIKCIDQRVSCLLTKKCGLNSTCQKVDDLLQHICVCDKDFIGDGNVCHLKVNCENKSCGPNSFCEPTIIKDLYGNLQMNGKCSCEPGYSRVNGKCEDPRLTNETLWMSMGEAIISLGVSENRSRIRLIDSPYGDDSQYGRIMALAGDCVLQRLYWSGQNGATIRSSFINNITGTTNLMSGLGKVTGITVDGITGNIFFTDNNNGKIHVFDPIRNLSKTIIHLDNYHPGQIFSHSTSGQLYWIVNDFLNPRIETSSMNGKKRKAFIKLKGRPISLVIVNGNKGNDTLCWIEIKDKLANENLVKKSLSYGLIRCTNLSDKKYPPIVKDLYNISSEEPSSALTFSGRFYWGVQKGKFLRVLDNTLSHITIQPNCCDVAVRGIVVISEKCLKNKTKNPCFSTKKDVCNHICVQQLGPNGKLSPQCLESDEV